MSIVFPVPNFFCARCGNPLTYEQVTGIEPPVPVGSHVSAREYWELKIPCECGCELFDVRLDLTPEVDKVLGLDKAKVERINHPAHYGGDTTYEAIKVIEAWQLGFCLGCAVKYICRFGKKDDRRAPIEDLKKAVWYLNHEIQRLENENNPAVVGTDSSSNTK